MASPKLNPNVIGWFNPESGQFERNPVYEPRFAPVIFSYRKKVVIMGTECMVEGYGACPNFWDHPEAVKPIAAN